MLSCTAEPAPSEAKMLGGWKLSCTFEQAGTSAVQHYAGEITGLDQATTMAAGKALLVWNVLAAPAARKTANLVGIHKTTQDAALPPQSLIGGPMRRSSCNEPRTWMPTWLARCSCCNWSSPTPEASMAGGVPRAAQMRLRSIN